MSDISTTKDWPAKRMIDASWLAELRFLSSLTASPDQKRAAFIVKQADLENNDYLSSIWLLQAGKTRRLTGQGQESSFIFLDDKTLLFPARRTAEQKKNKNHSYFYRIRTDGGEAEFFFALPLLVEEIVFWQDDCYLVRAKTDINKKDEWKTSKQTLPAAGKKEQDWLMQLDEIPFRQDNFGSCQSLRTRLFFYDAKKEQLTPISELDQDVKEMRFDPPKNKMLVRINDRSSTRKNRASLCDDLYELDLASLEMKAIYDKRDLQIGPAFYWQGKIFALASDMKDFGLNQNYQLYSWQQKNLLTEFSDQEILFGNSICSDIRLGSANDIFVLADEVYYLSTSGGEGQLKKIDASGSSKTVIAGAGSVEDFVFVDNDLYLVGFYANRPQEIYRLQNNDLKDEDSSFSAPEDLQRISHFNDDAMQGIEAMPAESLNIEINGDLIEGFVIRPQNFEQGKSYPGILDIHGGPKTAYGTSLFHEMQLLSARGYFVFFCNPHGSDGRTDEFSDLRGKYGTIDYEDLLSFTQAVLAQYPQIDEQRLGVTGGSYGGFMTNWIISHTDQFKAAVTQRSIMNWLSFYGNSDIGYFFTEDQNDASFYTQEGLEKLWDHSPLKYAARIKTPTLIIHSEKDFRCPIEQVYQLFTLLKYRGIDSKMVIFKDESHELSRSGKPLARIERLEQIADWMDKYLQL